MSHPRLDLQAAQACELMLPPAEMCEIYLIGCGGTGSLLAPHLARLMRLHQEIYPDKQLRMVFVDPDLVEEKNLYRQNFVPADVGRSKAQTLAMRYGLANGVEISALSKAFDGPLYLASGERFNTSHIYIGCVDNPAGRNTIKRQLRDAAHLCLRHGRRQGRPIAFDVWLDCGNEKHSGQVLLGSSKMERNAFRTFKRKCLYLPWPSEVHPELLDDDGRSKTEKEKSQNLSCAELALSDPQSLTINNVIAAIAADYMCRLLITRDLNRFATYIDLECGFMKHCYITEKQVRKTLREARKS